MTNINDQQPHVLEQAYVLANDVRIPKLGLGTWFIADDKAAQAVRDAVDIGYRYIDTAQAYGNERGVGEGIRTASVRREDLFVSTKLAAEIKDFDGAVAAIDGSLETMGLDYIDLLLIHSPQPWKEFRNGNFDEGNLAAWRAMEDAHRAGKLRAIGVSNFQQHDLENILSGGTVEPHVNQVLTHVGSTPSELIAYCQSKGILVEGYSPVAHGAILDNTDVKAMASNYEVSVPQLCIRYVLQLGLLPLPKTANPDHMRSNAELDFVITDADMATLQALEFQDYGEDSKFPVFSGK